MLRTIDPAQWSGRRVLVTGHTGFKGAWLTCWLRELGAEVYAVSLPADAHETPLWDALAVEGVQDVRDDVAGSGWIDGAAAFEPEVVLHLAAQSLVSEGYRDPATTFQTNVMGTVRVLELVDRLPDLRAAVVVTTDKVYDVRQPTPFREGDFLGGKDPYSASKACAELVTQSWPHLSDRVVTARAGNVIGGGDFALNRIVPDIVRAWTVDETLVLRRPLAVRPWQHVIEPLLGYLLYAEDVAGGREVPRSLNFGPDPAQAVPVQALVEHAAGQWAGLSGGSQPAWEVDPDPVMEETHDLTLDASQAQQVLSWGNVWGWREAIDRSLQWYVRAADGERPADLVREQVAAYVEQVRSSSAPTP
ncbi:CDP-glucose 4,6-dehydratase [Nocardioides KLBMP 9356]|uniref:CDP-glucose 4,6-dehydratase n=1 Tax=Nocardioides potassii TaxID=2911371 RepID=A0ABS9H6Z6_9ACTN|nr:CDP-glucose 4,6-dehydratase [Nocardioides potassii]MCF6376997.1 CDP-glucose 4,6-dehydratase [Nocardioides potassii]